MSDAPSADLPGWFRGYPGIVLRLSSTGIVLASNGRLEAELGRDVAGAPFAACLDDASSVEKWRMLLHARAATSCELVLAGADTLPEPRGFSVLPDDDSGGVLLLEQQRDPRLDDLRDQVTITNSDLAVAQRELLKERGRLAYALEKLDAQYQEKRRLAAQLTQRNVELQRSNRALDDFAHAVSHDLKAPLRAIANFARWVDEDAGPALDDEARSHLRSLQQRVTRMRRMIDGVLDYARAGRERCQPERVDVADIVADVLELLDVPDDVTITTSPPLPTLVTERPPLQQVLHNLVGNAVKYAARGTGPPTVRIAAAPGQGGWEFTVSDNGPGIPEAAQPAVWQLFRTLAAPTRPDDRDVAGDVSGSGTQGAMGSGAGATRADDEGTGVGLAIVKRLVESRGGVAGVQSRPGEGATFRFTWPEETTD